MAIIFRRTLEGAACVYYEATRDSGHGLTFTVPSLEYERLGSPQALAVTFEPFVEPQRKETE